MDGDMEIIMTTLSTVQKQGWKHKADLYQFQIILANVLREKDRKLREVENALEKQRDKKEQFEYELNKLKNDNKYENDMNEELENELKLRRKLMKKTLILEKNSKS
jgi:hypothetical protein